MHDYGYGRVKREANGGPAHRRASPTRVHRPPWPCRAAHSASCVVLGFSRLGPSRILRPPTSTILLATVAIRSAPCYMDVDGLLWNHLVHGRRRAAIGPASSMPITRRPATSPETSTSTSTSKKWTLACVAERVPWCPRWDRVDRVHVESYEVIFSDLLDLSTVRVR